MSHLEVTGRLAHDHHVLTAGNKAIGLWVRAASWLLTQEHRSSLTLTQEHALALGSRADIAALVRAGLWEKMTPVAGTVCYRIVELDDLFTLEPPCVASRRSAARERQRRHRAHAVGDHSACDPDRCQEVTS